MGLQWTPAWNDYCAMTPKNKLQIIHNSCLMMCLTLSSYHRTTEGQANMVMILENRDYLTANRINSATFSSNPLITELYDDMPQLL